LQSCIALTAASMQLMNGNEEAWLPEEIRRIVKKLKIEGATGVQWKAAADTPLLSVHGQKKQAKLEGKVHSWFGKEQPVQLFKGRRWSNDPRHLISADAVGNGNGNGNVREVIVQHDAPLPLGSLSAYQGGCVARCKDPKTFSYSSAGQDVTIYIVDGV
jgi:hypothetical protein